MADLTPDYISNREEGEPGADKGYDARDFVMELSELDACGAEMLTIRRRRAAARPSTGAHHPISATAQPTETQAHRGDLRLLVEDRRQLAANPVPRARSCADGMDCNPDPPAETVGKRMNADRRRPAVQIARNVLSKRSMIGRSPRKIAVTRTTTPYFRSLLKGKGHFAFYRKMLITAVVISVAGVSDCWAADARPVKSLLELRHDKVVIQEWDLSCGAAALATILNYQYDHPVSEKDIARGLMSRREYIENPELVRIREGFSLLDLKRYVDSHGYRGIGYGKLTSADLVKKAPILVPVNFLGYNHFVVFRGFMKDRVLLADPAWGNRTMLHEDFESAWIDYGENMGKVGFVVERREGTVPPNQLNPRASDFVTLR